MSISTLTSRQWIPGLLLFVVLAATALIYWPGLQGPLMLDDFANLEPLQTLDSAESSVADVIQQNGSGPLGRPVSMVSFAVDYLSSGGDAWVLKRTNLLIHLICGCLVMWLSGLLLCSLDERLAWPVALWVAALWLAAPLLSSTVLYVVQRMAQLSTLFVLAGCINYVHARRLMSSRVWLGTALVLPCFALWLPLAVLSKENGILLPLLLLAIEGFLFRFAGTARVRGGLFALYAVSVALPAIAAATLLLVSPESMLGGYAGREFSLYERLLTQGRVLFTYLRAALLPIDAASFGLFHDDYPISQSITSPVSTLVALAGLLGIVIGAGFARSTGTRLVALAVIFFLAAHSLESSVFPLEMYFEHRNYLPLAGLFIGLGAALILAIQRVANKRAVVVVVVAIAYAGLFFALTSQRAETWRDWPMVLAVAAHHHPQSPRVHVELATLYQKVGRTDAAFAQLEQLAGIDATLEPGTRIHRALLTCESSIESSRDLSMGETPTPPTTSRSLVYVATAAEQLNNQLRQRACPNLDAPSYAKTLAQWALNTDSKLRGNAHWKLLFSAALANERAAPATALELLGLAAKLYPAYVEARFVEVRMHLHRGDLSAARASLASAVKAKPSYRKDLNLWINEYAELIDQASRTQLGAS